MNERKFLIWHYSSRTETWYDATENVVSFFDAGNCWNVRFDSSSRYYHVSYSKMLIFDEPKKVEFAELYYKDSPCFRVRELICFNDKVYKIFYESGYTVVAFPEDLKIVKDVLKSGKRASGVMSYYRRVVQETAESEDDLFLSQQFDDIDSVSEESVLALYLRGKCGKSSFKKTLPVIFPFKTNLSQIKALEMAFSNRISIIEGPPGTGKTQTILNFIANAVINNLSVAVVSNNNSATDNVYEKLDKYGYSFIAAPLGNSDNVDAFFEEYNSRVPSFKKNKVNLDLLRSYYDYLPYWFRLDNKRKILL